MATSTATIFAPYGIATSWCIRARRASCTIAWLAIIQCAVLLGAIAPVEAVVHGDVELLKAVQVQHRASVDSIRTWKGRAVKERRSVEGDNYEYRTTTTIDFALDQPRALARWNQHTEINRHVADGKPVSTDFSIEAGMRNAMAKRDRLYTYNVVDMEKHFPTHSLVIKEIRFAGGMEAVFNFDARYYLNDANVSMRLKQLYENATNPELSGWSVTRDGALVTVECRFGPDDTFINGYVFDMSKGAHLVSDYGKSTGVDHLIQYEYTQIDGVWVPAACTDELVNIRDGVKSVLTEKVKWFNSVVNRRLDMDEFWLVRLGVQPGDTIQNDLEHSRVKYQGDVVHIRNFLKAVAPLAATLVGKQAAHPATGPAPLTAPSTGPSADNAAPRDSRINLGHPQTLKAIGDRVRELQGERIEDSLTKLSRNMDYTWPGPNTESPALVAQLPLSPAEGGRDLDAILSNRRFVKLLQELGRLPKSEAAKLLNEEFQRTTKQYGEISEQYLATYGAEFRAGQPPVQGAPGVTYGVSFQISDNPDGSPTLLGIRNKLLALVLLAGQLELADCRGEIRKALELSQRERGQYSSDKEFRPEFGEGMLRSGCLFNRQVFASAILPLLSQSQRDQLAGQHIAADEVRLTAYDAITTSYETKFLHTPPDFSKGTLTVRIIASISDADYDLVLKSFVGE